MPFSYADSALPRQPDSASPGRAYSSTRALLGVADEILYPGRIGIQTGIAGTRPLVSLAVTANLPDAQAIVGTFASVDAADEISAVVVLRGKTVTIGPVIYATSQAATLTAFVTLANSTMDEAGFTAGQSIVFTDGATTITATAEVRGEAPEVIFSVQGDGTVSHATTNPGVFAVGSAKPALGVIIDGESAYAVEGGGTQIDDLSPCSCADHGPVDVELAAAGAITTNQALYFDAAAGAKITGTPSATTVWIPPSFLRASGQEASSTANPETVAVRVFVRS
jgi:hypothetical protein